MLATFESTARAKLRPLQKLRLISWPMILLAGLVAGIGFVMLYSAAGGSFDPWADRQMIRFVVGVLLMIGVAIVDLRVWLRNAYFIYLGALLLLIGVEIAGDIGMGAQRWIDLGIFQLQPSELMKVALVLALARYFHSLEAESVRRILPLVPPLLLIVVPALLVLKQPDLGTGLTLILITITLIFVSGLNWRTMAVLAVAGMLAAPLRWHYLKPYQRQRLVTFLNPQADPLGSGYHIIQSEIAIGAGGTFGKGFLNGTQARLNFLPEQHTDFIFAVFAEEFGLAGSIILLTLYASLIARGAWIARHARERFGALLAVGITAIVFWQVAINIGMATGILPVVGITLPLVSYGGSSLIAMMAAIGILISINTRRFLF